MQLFSLDKQKQQRKIGKVGGVKTSKTQGMNSKKTNQKFKRRQSIANVETLQIAKVKYQQLIKEPKIKDKTPQSS